MSGGEDGLQFSPIMLVDGGDNFLFRQPGTFCKSCAERVTGQWGLYPRWWKKARHCLRKSANHSQLFCKGIPPRISSPCLLDECAMAAQKLRSHCELEKRRPPSTNNDLPPLSVCSCNRTAALSLFCAANSLVSSPPARSLFPTLGRQRHWLRRSQAVRPGAVLPSAAPRLVPFMFSDATKAFV